MYEAVRQRAPDSSKIAGASATALILAIAGDAIMTGFGAQIVRAIQDTTTIVIVPPTPTEPLHPIDKIELDTATDELPMPEPPKWIPEQFEFDDSKTIAASSEPAKTVEAGPSSFKAPPVRRAPKMRETEKPSYPAAEIRAGNQGTTGLQLCIDAAGRVTSASLAQSSGHARLDEAALKWVRRVRFTPGSVDGAPQSVCGHAVSYEWILEEARG